MAQHPKELAIADFQYNLPEDRIAKVPLKQRDQSKLLFYQNGKIADHQFTDIASLLPKKSLLFFNDTKVVQARLFFPRSTGSIIEVFCLEPVEPHTELQRAMQQTRSATWNCLVGNAKKWKTDEITLHFSARGFEGHLTAEMVHKEAEKATVKFRWLPEELTFAEVLSAAGNLPLPPYFKRAATPEDLERYQTVYAANAGAVAAPTAGLHFTPEVFKSLEKAGLKTAYLTLHVGAGTFRPVKAETMAGHDMHSEQILVNRKMVHQILEHLPNPIIPVGTTSMRTLESLYWLGVRLLQKPETTISELEVPQWLPYETEEPVPVKIALEALLKFLERCEFDFLPVSTQILIAPGYDFKLCDGLVTNFHQPGSTLLLLVAALVGEDWKKIYEHALAGNYRFLSYGDSSLLLKNGREMQQKTAGPI